MKKQYAISIIVIYLLLTALIYIYIPTPESHLEKDSYGYEKIALNFLNNGRLTPHLENDIPVQTIGYPFFLGLIYRFFGHHWEYVIVIQLLLSIMTGLLIYRIATLLFNELIGYGAFSLWAINLGFLIYPHYLLTEILLVTLLCAFLERFITFLCTRNHFTLCIAGILGGLSVIVKPVALWLFLFLLISLLIKNNMKSAVITGFLFSFCFYTPVVSYMTYNKIMHNIFSIGPLLQENLFIYVLAKMKVHTEQISYTTALNEVYLPFQQYRRSDPNAWHTNKKSFFTLMKTHPFLLPKLWIHNIIKTYMGLFSTQLKVLLHEELEGGMCSFSNTSGPLFYRFKSYIFGWTSSSILKGIALLEALYNYFRFIFIWLALFYLFLHKQYFLSIFFIVPIAYLSFITGHDGCARYRLMFEPLLIVLTALGIYIMYMWLTSAIKKNTVVSHLNLST